MSKYEVHYSIRGTITVEASDEEEARNKVLSSDETDTSVLFRGLESNIEEAGNDAISIDDIYKSPLQWWIFVVSIETNL